MWDGSSIDGATRVTAPCRQVERGLADLSPDERFVGDDTKIDVEFCDVIPLSETRKRSPVVSTVQEDNQSLSVAAPRADVP